MPYTKTTWENGDIITATKLNKIETGIYDNSLGSGGALIINDTVSNDTHTLDKRWQEIYDAVQDGYVPILKDTGGAFHGFCKMSPYYIGFYDTSTFYADNNQGYPYYAGMPK